MIDRYTKAVLTLIAVSLSVIALNGLQIMPTVQAQNSAQDISIVYPLDNFGNLKVTCSGCN